MTRQIKLHSATRHIVSINDLKNREIETIFDTAQSFLREYPDATFPYRVGQSTNLASKYIVASLFYEPSTRTRLSFESAMLRLGGRIITSADPNTSSAAKGESLADSVRVVANYADILVIRHPCDGAARLAAEYSPVPVINGGDGSHEHPTQTLCDLFTLRQKNKHLTNLKVAISGDLKGSRTVHSFVYALARFGATIEPMAAKGMELPPHVYRRLREEFNCKIHTRPEVEDNKSFDALYVTPDRAHQPSLFAGSEIDYGLIVQKKIDAVYVTRFQKERWTEKEQPYPKVDMKFLNEPKYSDASVLHPLPRVGELDASIDSDIRAVYFEQASYGVPVRMALISLLLGVRKNVSLQKYPGGFENRDQLTYNQPVSLGLRCVNNKCIVHEEHEQQYVRNKFYIIESPNGCLLRCVYCETDIDETHTNHFIIADTKKGQFTKDIKKLCAVSHDKLKEIIIFPEESDAVKRGFELYDASRSKARARA
jgi:aspartate carbamoyltransferase catalytic subunit